MLLTQFDFLVMEESVTCDTVALESALRLVTGVVFSFLPFYSSGPHLPATPLRVSIVGVSSAWVGGLRWWVSRIGLCQYVLATSFPAGRWVLTWGTRDSGFVTFFLKNRLKEGKTMAGT